MQASNQDARTPAAQDGAGAPGEGAPGWEPDQWVAQFVSPPLHLQPLEFEYLPIPEPEVQLDADFTRAFSSLDRQMERVRSLLEQVDRGTMGENHQSKQN
ncbi:MAG: hypothetical protein Q4P06_09060 [Actinomycetaceae bacterium]|nr:hypothetical protein [Actinomycetaceae bacterium]